MKINESNIKVGDRVEDKYGRNLIVVRVHPRQIFVKEANTGRELANWYHESNLRVAEK